MAPAINSKPSDNSSFDRNEELKAFDDTKAGVKGLVDAGVTTIPRFFIHPCDKFTPADPNSKITIPTIDLGEAESSSLSRKKIVDEINKASETWGFFQVINHGIPLNLCEEMLGVVKRFYEQDPEVKKGYYTRDLDKSFVYNTNFDLFSETSVAANWRDTFFYSIAPNPPKPEDLPFICRHILIEYAREVLKLGSTLMELLSEALGLKTSHLNDMGCSDGISTLCNYYPPCPQPELTLGATKHCDDSFVTILLQDQISALQVAHQDQWFDVLPIQGALVVNVGDLLQLISNDRFKSGMHRVLANHTSVPRVSVACFIMPGSKAFGPIKELLSEDDPPRYRELTAKEFSQCVRTKGLDGSSKLIHFRR